MISRHLRRRIALIMLLSASLCMVFIALNTLFIANAKEIEINIRRYAIEGNTTVISTFYSLTNPGKHDICVRLNEDNGLEIIVSVIMLGENETRVLIEYNSTLGKQVCKSFTINSKVLYGFVVSTLISRNIVENPYAGVSVSIIIK